MPPAFNTETKKRQDKTEGEAFMKIGIIGLGLIGGSMAKAIHAATSHFIIGWDRNADTLQTALHEKVIDQPGREEDFCRLDLLILALYPGDTVKTLERIAPFLSPKTVVVDTCGIKRCVCEPLGKLARQYGFTFVGGHPMAGKEVSGYRGSDAKLFENASFLLCPLPGTQSAIQPLLHLLRQIGFSKIVKTSPEEHDDRIAFTSQLPHVLACAYILDPAAPLHDGFSAGSYKDVSRVASINAEMWSELFLDNRDYLCRHIEQLTDHLDQLKSAIASGDSAAVSALLKAGNDRKQQIG